MEDKPITPGRLSTPRQAGVDNLFQPTIQDKGGQAGADHQAPPWQLHSQMYVAFFGGGLAAGVIAYLNGKRLGLPSRQQSLLLGIGMLGFLMTIAAAIALAAAGMSERWLPGGSGFRIVSRVIALLTYVVLRRIQRPAFRVYAYYGKGEFASLWVPGLIATVLCGILQSAATSSAVRYFFDQ